MTNDIGYLHHGHAPGPFLTERVFIKSEAPGAWFASYEGRWRTVHIRIRGLFIVYRGERITIQIDGV